VDRRAHWEGVYGTKGPEQVSWFQAEATLSLDVRHAVRPGGLVLVATFAEDGPLKCSGLEVARYSPDALHAQFGADFRVIESHREEHRTPSGAVQRFTYCLGRHEPHRDARRVA
jgi:hypothetical protein